MTGVRDYGYRAAEIAVKPSISERVTANRDSVESAMEAGSLFAMAVNSVNEAADGPTQPEAEPILLGKGIEILPAILCNAGGVTVSYVEWVQNKNNETRTLDEVDRRLRRQRDGTCDRVRDARQRYKCTLRHAAYAVALDRIGRVYKQRGIFP